MNMNGWLNNVWEPSDEEQQDIPKMTVTHPARLTSNHKKLGTASSYFLLKSFRSFQNRTVVAEIIPFKASVI